MARSIDIEKILDFGARYVTNKQTAALEDEALAWLLHPNIFGKQATLKMGESSGQDPGEEPAPGTSQAGTGTAGGGSPGSGNKGPAGGPAQGGGGPESQGGTQGPPGTGAGLPGIGMGAMGAAGAVMGGLGRFMGAGIGAIGRGASALGTAVGTGIDTIGRGIGAAGTGTGAPGTGTGASSPLPGVGATLPQEQIKYDTGRTGLQTVPGAGTPPQDATDPEGQSEIKGSPVDWGTIRKKITDAQEYRNNKDANGFQADADLLKEAVKNRENNQWLQENKDKVNGALERIFEYGALQWATEGFQIKDPAVIRSRVQKLYDVALGNGRLDPRDLDLVYSRFTRQLGLPAREVVTDPTTKKQITVKNSTTFEMFQNWMNSAEVPWWHKAALVIGIPLAFAGLVTKLAGGSTGASLALGGTGLLLSGIGGLFAYTGAQDLEKKRLAEQTDRINRLKELQEEQAGYEALDAPYSSFGPEGKDFFGRFFNQEDGKQPVPDPQALFGRGNGSQESIFNPQAVEKFLSLANAPGKQEEAEKILFVLSSLNNAGVKVKLIDDINDLQGGSGASFEEISHKFRELLDTLPSDLKGKILGEMGYDPASIQTFKYLENLGSRGEDVYGANKSSGKLLSDLILGIASPEELLRATDRLNENIILKDAATLPRKELEQNSNRNLGVFIAKNKQLPEDLYTNAIVIPSIANALEYSGVTYSDIAFLNSLAMNAKPKSTGGQEQTAAENKEQAQARLVGDILNSGLIPPNSDFLDEGAFNVIYGEATPYLSIPGTSLKTFIQIARDNMDYVSEDSKYKSLAGLMIHDLRKYGVNSRSAAYIDDVVNISSIPQSKKELVANSLKQLVIEDPTAAVMALGLFNPVIDEQTRDPEIWYQVPLETLQRARNTINYIKNNAWSE